MKRYGLSASERIKSSKEIENIFSAGEMIYSLDKSFRAHYLLSAAESGGVYFTVAVSKKFGNAVWRNRIKRLIREVYRHNKSTLIEACIYKNYKLRVIFSPQTLNQKRNKSPRLNDIEPGLKQVINKLSEKI